MPDLLRNDGCPWLQEKSREIKEMTVKGLQPEIERLLAKHKAEIRRYRERGAGGREGERGREREREGKRATQQLHSAIRSAVDRRTEGDR